MPPDSPGRNVEWLAGVDPRHTCRSGHLRPRPGPGSRGGSVVKTYKMFIGGEMSDAADGDTRTITSPATGEELAVVPEASAADVDRAVGAAKKAFDETW